MKQVGKKLGIIIFWLLVWQLISICVNNSILLVGPWETLRALCVQACEATFWKTAVFTTVRISCGFLLGVTVGFFLALLSKKSKITEAFLEPVMQFFKTVPVASFVVLFLIWWRADKLAMIISFMVVMPHIYVNTLEGLKAADKKLLEMAAVFEMPVWNKFFYIYRPALKPFLDSGIKVTAGMSWKSGVAAEVIGIPLYSVGEQLYMSKINLDTAGVLAWTLVVIFLSAIFEQIVLWVWKKWNAWNPSCVEKKRFIKEDAKAIVLQDVSKQYDGKVVLQNVCGTYGKEKVTYLNSPSGSGKTTLLRVLAGLEKADSGLITNPNRYLTYVFQEDRLCEEYNAVKNLELVCGNSDKARKHLLELLNEEDLNKPCKALSGGMKRRVAVARAFCVDSEVVLLDEPFTGLDEENKRRVREYIEKYGTGKVMVIASHGE